MVAGTVTLHAELPPGSPNLLLLRALVGSPILHAPARQVLDVSTDKPPLLPKLVVCPHWCAWKFGILGDKKLESLLVAVSCCCLLGAGSFSLGMTGASPAWVCWAPWSESWVFTDCLVESTLSCTFTRVSAGGSALEIWEKLKAEERLNSLSLCTNIYNLTQPWLCPFMRFCSQWHWGHRQWQILLLSHSFTGKDLGLAFDTEFLPPKAVALFQFTAQWWGSLWGRGRRFPAAVIN